MKTSKPKSQPNDTGEPLRIPKWEANAERLDSLRDIRKDDDIAIVIDILVRKYGWGYRKNSHRLCRADKQDVPFSELKPCEDYFDTEDDIKAYVHGKFGWIGPKGKEYIPPAIKRERKKPQYLDELPDTTTSPKRRRKRKSSKTTKAADQQESHSNGGKPTRQRLIVYQFSTSYIKKLNQSYIEKKGISVQQSENKVASKSKPTSVKKKENDNITKGNTQIQHELITPLPVFSSNRVSLQKERPESPKWV
jgi:hypothetical protein